MKRKNNGSSGKRIRVGAIKDASRDPKVMAEINKFIKITTGVYKLKDYRLN